MKGETVTGFPNVEEDAADRMTWEAGALPEGKHIMNFDPPGRTQ